MTLAKAIVFSLSLLFAAALAQAQKDSKPTATGVVVESSKIRFYETGQVVGEENYQVTQLPNGELIVQVKAELPFAGQEKKPLVNATLRTAKDFTPTSFEIKGTTLLEIEEDTSIAIQDKKANVQDRGRNKSIELTNNFFTMSGYVPLTVEAMLVRYWLAHGRPTSIPLLPAGEAFVEFRGKDAVK